MSLRKRDIVAISLGSLLILFMAFLTDSMPSVCGMWVYRDVTSAVMMREFCGMVGSCESL